MSDSDEEEEKSESSDSDEDETSGSTDSEDDDDEVKTSRRGDERLREPVVFQCVLCGRVPRTRTRTTKTRAPRTSPAIRTQTSSAHLSDGRGRAVRATPPHADQWELGTPGSPWPRPLPCCGWGLTLLLPVYFFKWGRGGRLLFNGHF